MASNTLLVVSYKYITFIQGSKFASHLFKENLSFNFLKTRSYSLKNSFESKSTYLIAISKKNNARIIKKKKAGC